MSSWKKRFQLKRALAMLLAVCLIVPSIPVTAYASPEVSVEASQETGTNAETEPSSVEEGSVEDSVAEESSSVTESVVAEDEAEEAVSAEDAQDLAEEEKPVYEIEESIDEAAKTKEYSGSAVFYLEDSVYADSIVLTKDGENVGRLSDVGGYTYKWQSEKDGTYTDMAEGTEPINVGKYKLVVNIPEVADTYTAMSKEIDFEITKASLVVSWGYNAIKPGTKVSDIKLTTLYVSNDNSNYEYIADDVTTSDVDENAESPLAYSIKVKDTFTGKECAADSIIDKNCDYIFELTTSFTDKVSAEEQANYEAIPVVSDTLDISNLVATKINLTLGEKWKESGRITTQYTGKAIVLNETDYTAVVQYENGEDADGNTVWTDIADAEIITTWYDANGNALKAAPTDAGEYYVILSYAGKTGLYETCTSSRIYVNINRKEITIRPYLTENGFYAGTTVYDVLQKVDYDVYDASDEKMTIDKATFWGNYVDEYDVTLSYEPVFYVQESYDTTDATGESVVAYKTIDENDVLKKGKTYRVIFSGDKAVYRDYGFDEEWDYTKDINETYYSETALDPNHIVLVDNTTKEKYTADVKVAEGILAAISVDKIFKGDNKAGNSYENPISKVYDGDALYTSRNEYKKAEVIAAGETTPVAKDFDEGLTYTWYEQDGTTSQWNEETQQYEEVPTWKECYSLRRSPYNGGMYRLEVSYQHEDNKYVAEKPAYVYYKIDKQKVKVVPTGEYTVLTDTWVDTFINDTDFTYEIYTVPAIGEGEKLNWSKYSHDIYWTVQRKVVNTDDNTETWVDARGEQFVKDTTYRLAVDSFELKRGYIIWNNYVDYEIITEGEGENATTKTVYLNETKDITVKVMGATELNVAVVDPITIEKVYDGVAVDLSKQFADGKIKLVTAGENPQEVKDVEVEYSWYDVDYDVYVDAPVNAGTYTLYAEFKGNETYHSFSTTVSNVTATITPAEVVVTPVVKEEVKAGNSIPYVKSKTTFAGVAEADKDAFVYKLQYNSASHSYHYGWKAFANTALTMTVTDADKNEVTSGNYKGGKEYTVTAKLDGVNYPYFRNYTFKEGSAVFTPVRGNAKVTAMDTYGDALIISDKITDNNHVITPEEGIPYCDMTDTGLAAGNYIRLVVTAPEEYDSIPSTAVYVNQLKAAGACEVATSDNAIMIAFNASAYDKKEFSIRWEEDYVENFTVDFTKASLLDNLEEAQAPKTLSFVSPAKKMTIGDYQQLDVKLTKVLESDIISLKYESSNPDVLCVDEDGEVTALAAGSATITVSSVRKVNGKIVDTDPVKKASVAITVSEVSAPKITKVQAWDIYGNVYYTYPGNGYRREVYVLEGKKTVDEFETAIASMKNQKWEGIFVTAPYYYSNWGSMSAYFDDLEPNTEYTVYVRNVSRLGAFCECGEQCEITESVAGAVKTFKTTKVQAHDLNVEFEDGKAVWDYDADVYKVKLSAKNTTASVYGYFKDAADGAEEGDELYKALPLSKDEQKTYVNPKLKYYVGTYSNVRTKDTIFPFGNGYLNKTSLATINGKGKLTLKGVGTVCVVAYDTIGTYYAWEELEITAAADSIAGKTTTFKLGQSMDLSDLLIYKEGNKVLTGDYDRQVIVDEAVTKAFEENEYFNLYGTTVVAVKSGGTLQVTLSDAYVGADKTATVSLKSTALEPVKGLKTSFITDKFAKLEFTYGGYAKAFRVQITDGRGDMMKDVQIAADELYNYSTGKYVYWVKGLTQKSKYTVSITAVYGDESAKEESKAAKKTFMTTAIPASYDALGQNEEGGVAIQIYHKNASAYIDGTTLLTGNVYTLNLTNANDNLNMGAKYAQTDTLTWTSSNKKVATIKANKDTFTATFKPVKSGWTKIEVKSKITKAVIARYWVYIGAVGNADSFYGDNEPLPTKDANVPDDDDYGKPDYSEDEVVEDGSDLNFIHAKLNNIYDVDANAEEYIWYSFTAPSAGTYRFKASEGFDSDIWIFDTIKNVQAVYTGASSSDLTNNASFQNDGDSETGWNFNATYFLQAGQTVYFAVGSYGLYNAGEFSFTVTKE